jgi:protein-disulfide isomerase-like protein with CxxC motif
LKGTSSIGKWSKLPQLSPQRLAQLQQALLVRTSICSFEAQLITLIAYAFYFDYKRRNDPQFRKQLKKESKRQARAAKEEAEAQTVQQRQSIRRAVEEAKEEGFPTDVEEKEAYFMSEVARGEGLSGDGK